MQYYMLGSEDTFLCCPLLVAVKKKKKKKYIYFYFHKGSAGETLDIVAY